MNDALAFTETFDKFANIISMFAPIAMLIAFLAGFVMAAYFTINQTASKRK